MPSGIGTYGKKVGRPKNTGTGRAMSTADFNKKIAAIKANPALTAAQKQAKIKQITQTRIARKSNLKKTKRR